MVSSGRCFYCGACVASCPSDALIYENGPKLVGECKKCGFCVRVCPSYNPAFREIERYFLGRQRMPRDEFGIYKRAVISRSTVGGVLEKCQDGGAVTSILISALKSGTIDGAITSGIDPAEPWLPMPHVSTSKNEIIANAGTRYSLSAGIIKLKECVQAGVNKVAFVGTPCQILAVRRIQRIMPSCGKIVKLVIGLFCMANFHYDGVMRTKIQNELGLNLNDIKKINIKGSFIIYMKNGTVMKLSLKELKKFVMPCCQYCTDFSAELADISCGGVGLNGWTYTVIRTGGGLGVFADALRAGVLKAESPPQSATQLLLKMSNAKRNRAKEFQNI